MTVSEGGRATAQRELELGDLRVVVPWQGQSPRVLTRSYLAFSFTAEGMGRLDQDASLVGDIEQELLGQELLPFAGEAYG